MAIGIAGDTRFSSGTTVTVSEATTQELLTQILVELRTSNSVVTTLQPVPAVALSDIRADEEYQLGISGVDVV